MRWAFQGPRPQYEAVAEEVETYSGDKLTEVFETDVATAFYVTPQLETQAIVTI